MQNREQPNIIHVINANKIARQDGGVVIVVRLPSVIYQHVKPVHQHMQLTEIIVLSVLSWCGVRVGSALPLPVSKE